MRSSIERMRCVRTMELEGKLWFYTRDICGAIGARDEKVRTVVPRENRRKVLVYRSGYRSYFLSLVDREGAERLMIRFADRSVRELMQALPNGGAETRRQSKDWHCACMAGRG